MPKSVKNMLAEANASVPKLPPADAAKMMTGENVLIVDVRDPSEVEKSGKIKGAVNVSARHAGVPCRFSLRASTTTRHSTRARRFLPTAPLAVAQPWQARR